MRQRQRPEQQQHHNDLLDTAPTDESAAVRRRRREDEEARAATLAQLRLGGPRIEVTLQGLFVAVGLLVVGYVVTMVFPWLSPSSLLALWRRGLYALDDWITVDPRRMRNSEPSKGAARPAPRRASHGHAHAHGGSQGTPRAARSSSSTLCWWLLLLLLSGAVVGLAALVNEQLEHLGPGGNSGSTLASGVSLAQDLAREWNPLTVIAHATTGARLAWQRWRDGDAEASAAALEPLWQSIGHGQKLAEDPRGSVAPPPQTGKGRPAAADASPPSSARPAGTAVATEAASAASAAASTATSAGAKTPPLSCFTLEEYSRRFLARPDDARAATTPPPLFFGCGTRLTDLRTNHTDTVKRACAPATGAPSSSPSSSPSTSAFPDLRVLLSAREVALHAQHRRQVALQRIPLAHLMDDYCDCMDGTDEPLTNACSMAAGAGMILAETRWPSYLNATAHVTLYEEEADAAAATEAARAAAAAETAAAAAAGGGAGSAAPKNPLAALLAQRPWDPIAARRHALGGPVLPVPCAADPLTWLAPSLVGDGIVDCCDGSDETGAAGGDDDDDDSGSSSSSSAQGRWVAYRRAVAPAVDRTQPPRRDTRDPHLNSTAALLLSSGHGTRLMGCDAVRRVRLESAEALRDRVRRGHEEYRRRADSGWAQLGRHFAHNETEGAKMYDKLIAELKSAESVIAQRRASAPSDAKSWEEIGVTQEQLQQVSYLHRMKTLAEEELRYIALVLAQKPLGAQFEYYPLHGAVLMAPAADADVSTYPLPADGARRAEVSRRRGQHHPLRSAELERAVVEATQQAMAARLPGLPPHAILHVDNISTAFTTVHATRTLSVAIALRPEDEAYVAVKLGVVANESAYEPGMLERSQPDPLRRHAMLPLGLWSPYSTEPTAAAMRMVDPTGDAALARRALVRPQSVLTLGGGRAQWPSRLLEPPRTIRLRFADGAEADAKTRVQNAAKNVEDQHVVEMPLMYHQNTPNRLATQVFTNGMRCDRPEAPRAVTEGRVLYVCDVEDRVLHWGVNGLCRHEAVVGTPSACAHWVLEAAEAAVRRSMPEGASV